MIHILHHHHGWLNSLSQTSLLSHFMMHRSYILPLLTLLLQLFAIVSVYILFLDWVCDHGICRQNKKTLNKCNKQTNHAVLHCKCTCTVTDGVCSDCTASKFVSMLWAVYMLGSTIVHSQQRMLSQKWGHKLRSVLNWQRALKQIV
jgi:hypothetical protein